MMPFYVYQDEFIEFLRRRYRREVAESRQTRMAEPVEPQVLYCRNVFKEDEACEVFAACNGEQRSLGVCERECKKLASHIKDGKEVQRSYCFLCHRKRNRMWRHKQKNAQLIAKAACVAEAVESRNASGGGKPAEGMVSGGGVSEAGYATTSDEEEQEGLSDWEDEDVKAFKLYGTIPQSPRRTLAEKAARAAEEASRKKRSMREAIVRLRAEKGLQIRVEQLRKRKAEKEAEKLERAGSRATERDEDAAKRRCQDIGPGGWDTTWQYFNSQATHTCDSCGDKETGEEVSSRAPGWEKYADLAPPGYMVGVWAQYYPDDSDDPALPPEVRGMTREHGAAAGVKLSEHPSGQGLGRSPRGGQQKLQFTPDPAEAKTAAKKGKTTTAKKGLAVVILSGTSDNEGRAADKVQPQRVEPNELVVLSDSNS